VISEQSKQSIDYIFGKSAKKSLILNPDDSCVIEQMTDCKDSEFLEREMVVLTISSLVFRVLTIFHIGEDRATRNYFLSKTTDKSLLEFFSEIGNLCSGAMNQELLRYFPHLGMSTPYTLSGRCLPFLNELKPGYLSRHAITINDSVRLQATLCLCGYAPIDFAVDRNDAIDTSGELEFF
jgi:hypothetical protein